MNCNEYQSDATVTDLMDYQPVVERLKNIPTLRVLHAAMGCCTESGELMDAVKKYLVYGKPLDRVNLQEEAGDMFWYVALLADAVGFTFEDTFEKNVAKLKARYPNKFNEHDAINRNLETERSILEAETMTYKSKSGAISSEKKPGYDMLTLNLLRRAAARMDLGALNYERHNWRKGINDKYFILERLNHAVEHLFKAIHEVDFNAPMDDDNLAAVVVNCMMAMEYQGSQCAKPVAVAESGGNKIIGESDKNSEDAQLVIINAIPMLTLHDAEIMLQYLRGVVSDMKKTSLE